MLPRRFAELDARTLVPHAALNALLGMGLTSAALIAWFGALEAAILAAAAAAALVYAAVLGVRERVPFAEPDRTLAMKRVGYVGAALLSSLAAAVVIEARAARGGVLILLAGAAGLAWLAARRLGVRAHGSRQQLQPIRSARAIAGRVANAD
jgi:amino acid transporter